MRLRLAAAAMAAAGTASAAVDLGAASTFGVLAGTYNGIGASSVITGDLGYTVLSGSATPAVSGTIYVGAGATAQAGAAQGAALAALNAMPCTFTFPSGAVDLGSDTTHGPQGVYTPGVYCVDAAMNLAGAATITLNGYGYYVFRSTGAFNTAANTHVVLAGGAVPSDVFWTPAGATTLGATSSFIGTVIDNAGITLGTTVSWTGRALAYAGTVVFDTEVLTLFTPVLSISIVSATAYDFQAVGIGSTTVSATTFAILNDGNVPVLLSLSVADPAPWVSTVSGAPTGMNQYELDAQFNTPGPPTAWSAAAHGLTTAATPSSLTRFAGNEDAAFMSIGDLRHLWVRFLAPVLTDQVGPRAMVVTIMAQVP